MAGGPRELGVVAPSTSKLVFTKFKILLPEEVSGVKGQPFYIKIAISHSDA